MAPTIELAPGAGPAWPDAVYVETLRRDLKVSAAARAAWAFSAA